LDGEDLLARANLYDVLEEAKTKAFETASREMKANAKRGRIPFSPPRLLTPPQKLNPFGTAHDAEVFRQQFCAGALLSREPEPDDYIFGDNNGNGILSTTDFYQIFGATGSGKTLFALAKASYIAAGKDFIGWPCKRPRRVLYLDGELPEKTLQNRLRLYKGLCAAETQLLHENLFIVSREMLISKLGADLAPLDSPAGAAQLLWLVDELDIDVVFMDSRFCLLEGDMKEAGSMPKSLILSLRNRHKAQ